ncbi:radical SAM protein [Mesorhizobium sp.]|uniref:radical SAM/SPASM domain-containing protein n=1 Tax=Mesorhizobium sp. TaxID=1871066 RepID=UPI0012215034|nr:radical SAM protein [Mesorhizobium sp.]TIL43285.1 MAG: SPASM domain-containing protein [Mesorhizobium sp.]
MRKVAAIAADPAAPAFKRFSSPLGEHVLIVSHSRVFDLSDELARDWDADPVAASHLALVLAEQSPGEAPLSDVILPTAQSLSLNVSSACNLSCGYCYADRGGFGGAQSKRMTPEVALAAVDSLLAAADPKAPVTIGFLGGEPLLNRALVHKVVAQAESAGSALGLDVRFSMTSNGTLLTEADIAMMRDRRFALTVSVDGDGDVHDLQRPTIRGKGTFAELAKRLAPLLTDPGKAQVAARMTVRAGRIDLTRRVDAVLGIGFSEVGVSPLRVSRDGSELNDSDWPHYLAELIALSRRELAQAITGNRIRLTNFAVALKRIHAGASSPYPCGAGGGYFSVAAEGKWYACHRAIGDDAFALGDNGKLDEQRRQAFLVERHVHSQTDCRSCWARYLCSGTCHQEAPSRTGAGCDFIRDWLNFCLAAYCELSSARPDYFGIHVVH